MYPRVLHPMPHTPGRMLAHMLALVSLLLMFQVPLPATLPPSIPTAIEQAPPTPASILDRLPLSFVSNPGPTHQGVQFWTQVLGGSVGFTAEGLRLALPGAKVSVAFVGVRPDVRIEGRERQAGVANLYQSSDPARSHTGLPSYAALVYPQLHPGVDLRYDGVYGDLKGTYQLAPGADPARIRWRYEGVERVELDVATGDLRLVLPAAEGQSRILVERAPVAWQQVAGQRHTVSVRYTQGPDGSISFVLGAYDSALPLTIDPILEYSTYLGGTSWDEPLDMLLDPEGNIILVGTTGSPDFPTTTACSAIPRELDTSVFVIKLNPAGSEILFSTLFGGGGKEEGNAVALDRDGQIVVAGTTLSQNLPISPTGTIDQTPGGDRDAFVAIFDPEGALRFSTYLGGSGYDIANAVAVDQANRILVAGGTSSADFPTVSPLQGSIAGVEDVFITSISPDRKALAFSTYFGGVAPEEASDIAVDQSGGLVITGATESPDFPVVAAFQPVLGGAADAFVLALGPNGSALRFSTYLGGAQNDAAAALTLDPAGNSYLTGRTASGDFPTTRALQPALRGSENDAFVASLSGDGATLRFSTYLGGLGGDAGQDIALGAGGAVVVTGSTSSTDFPLDSRTRASNHGSIDLFVSRISADGAFLQFSTYLGGKLEDYGSLVAVDKENSIVIAGATNSTDELAGDPLQPYASGSGDLLLARIVSRPRLELSATTDQTVLSPCEASSVCASARFTFTLQAVDGAMPVDLGIQLPREFGVPEEVQGGYYDQISHEVIFSSTVTLDAPVTISYRARLLRGALPGAVLTTHAQDRRPNSSVQFSLPVVVAQPDFTGTIVLIYASGDNNLASAMQQLLANAAHGSTNPDVRTLLLLDGPGADDTILYRLRTGAAGCANPAWDTSCPGVDRWSWPGDQLANRQNLTAFLSGALRAYPGATRRVLSLVGHGGGWSPPVLEGQPSGHGVQPSDDPMGGMLWDQQPRGALSTPELGRALRDAVAQSGQPFDLLFLDACDMAMAEVAYEVRDSARYLLASANWKWAGFPYDQHIASATGSAEEIGRKWLRQETDHLRRWQEPFTYALIDLEQIDTLRAATDALAKALMRPGGPLSSSEGRRLLLDASAAADRFDSSADGAIRVGSSRADADHYVDLGSLATQLSQTFGSADPAVVQAAQTVSAAVERAVIAREMRGGWPWLFPGQHWSWTASAGLSIYLPLHYEDWRLRYYRLIQFDADGQWGAMLNSYWQITGAPSFAYIPPSVPSCDRPCGPPFVQPRLKPLTYLPLVRR